MKELNLRLRALIHAVIKLKDILSSDPTVEYTPFLVRMLEDLPSGDDRMPELKKRLADLNSVVN